MVAVAAPRLIVVVLPSMGSFMTPATTRTRSRPPIPSPRSINRPVTTTFTCIIIISNSSTSNSTCCSNCYHHRHRPARYRTRWCCPVIARSCAWRRTSCSTSRACSRMRTISRRPWCCAMRPPVRPGRRWTHRTATRTR
uniref:Putative secreted peptide n=1 Tax=Anopheles braziliensis TaxID=58242 RepID=A0A2M3ZR86_9DIPT